MLFLSSLHLNPIRIMVLVSIVGCIGVLPLLIGNWWRLRAIATRSNECAEGGGPYCRYTQKDFGRIASISFSTCRSSSASLAVVGLALALLLGHRGYLVSFFHSHQTFQRRFARASSKSFPVFRLGEVRCSNSSVIMFPFQ